MTSQLQAKFCKHAEPAKQKKLLSVVALSVNQEITKLKPYHMAYLKVTILQNWKFNKTGIHHMAFLGLPILQKLEVQQNWNSPHGISRFADSTKLEIQQNWNFTTWHLWTC